MNRLTSFASVILLLVVSDLPHVYPLRPEPVTPLQVTLPVMAAPSDLLLAVVHASAGKKAPPQAHSRLALLR